MSLRSAAFALTLAAAPLASGPAHALMVTLVATGTITSSVDPAFTIGETASLTLVYDAATPDAQPGLPGLGEYPGAATSVLGTFAGIDVVAPPQFAFSILDGDPDQLSYLSAGGGTAPGYEQAQLQLFVRGGPGLLASDALPTADLDPLLIGPDSFLGLLLRPVGAATFAEVRATVASVSIAPTDSRPPPGAEVPVPAAGLLLGTALGALGLRRRRADDARARLTPRA